TFELSRELAVTPFAGMVVRHNMTGGYQERGAGDFNLSVSRYSETATDAVAGLRVDYKGRNGWSASATLEGGPNVGYSQSGSTASLQGMQGQKFRVNGDKDSGGLNSRASVGANYRSGNTGLDMNVYQWREQGAADNGFMLNATRSF
ncbi:BigB, partial [Erwinia typographi]